MKKIILILIPLLFLLLSNETSALDENSSYGIGGFQLPGFTGLPPEDQNRLLDLIYDDAGVRWTRNFLTWSEVQPEEDVWNWTEFDQRIQMFQNHGFHQDIILAGTPAWASKMGCDPEKSYSCPPENIDNWKRFVRQAVRRYKGQVKYWEIWNEPNLEGHFQGTPGEYFQLLKTAYVIIKEEDPSAKVVFGGIAGIGFARNGEDPFVRELFDIPEIGNYFDILNFHSYEPVANNRFRNILLLLKEIALPFSEKPLWLTETGSSSDAEITVPPFACPVPHPPGRQCKCYCYNETGDPNWYKNCPADGYTDQEGERLQAIDLKKRYNIALNLGFGKIFWYYLKDSRSFCRWAAFGIIRDDLTLKPSYCTLKKMTTGIPCPTPPPTPTPTSSPSPTPSPSPIPGDITDDHDVPGDEVNIYDYNLLVSDFGKTGTPGWIPADIIENGGVDIFDYNVLVENFGK